MGIQIISVSKTIHWNHSGCPHVFDEPENDWLVLCHYSLRIDYN